MKLLYGGQREFAPVLLFLAVCVLADAAPVKVWEDKLVLPTYPEEPPNPNPDFSVFNPNDTPNYPYPLRKSFGEKRKEQTWRTLNLENEYLFCRVLPDLGGHLYSCRDKLSNREMFYANPVVKKGPEALRGSFVAMGIESNFPTGHSETTTSPIDFSHREYEDGAASVIVGNIDRITGMQWRVEYVLRPASAVLEQHVTLYNRSDARHRYYWWSNAAIEYDDKKMRAIYPTRVMRIKEGGDMVPWPVGTDGVDVSLIAANKVMNGYFAYGTREPFMAIYKPSSRTGVAHFADSGVKGKKLWVWGEDGDNDVKQRLTDRFNSYVEMQAGLFENQTDFDFLEPQQVREFTEYWIPFRDMDGLSRANTKAAVLLVRTGKAVTAQAVTTNPQPGAKVQVVCSGHRIIDTPVDLDPARAFNRRVETDAPDPCSIHVLSSSGAPLIEHTDRRYDADAPSRVQVSSHPQPGWAGEQTEAALIARGEANERDGHLRIAWDDYNAVLQGNAKSAAARRHLARMAVLLGRPEEAVAHATAAVAADPADEASAYYLGVAQAMLGRDGDAKSAFVRVKAGSALFYSAQVQLAIVTARAGDVNSAIGLVSRVASDAKSASRAGALHVSMLRRAGHKEAAIAEVRRWRRADPLDGMLRFEDFLLTGKDEGMWAHLAGDPERILNIVDEYINLGWFDNALQLLTHDYPEVPSNQVEVGMPSPAQHALIAYYRAWCKSKSGQNADREWKAAAALPSRYIFPSRFSSYAVLEAAVKQNPKDAVAQSLLGSLYMNSLRVDDAIQRWQQALSLDPNQEGLHRNLGRALLELKNDPAAAQALLKAGLRVDKENTELTTMLENATATLKEKPGRRSSKQQAAAAPLGPAAQTAIAAMVKAATGSVDDALATFTEARLTGPDQTAEVRQAYAEVQLQKSLSLARSARCEDALASLNEFSRAPDKFIKYPHFQYYLAVIEDRCGRQKEARKRWEHINVGKNPLPGAETVYPYLASIRIEAMTAKSDAQAALTAIEAELRKRENASHSWLLFAQAALMRAVGGHPEAIAILKRAASISSDPLAQYLSLVELNLAGESVK